MALSRSVYGSMPWDFFPHKFGEGFSGRWRQEAFVWDPDEGKSPGDKQDAIWENGCTLAIARPPRKVLFTFIVCDMAAMFAEFKMSIRVEIRRMPKIAARPIEYVLWSPQQDGTKKSRRKGNIPLHPKTHQAAGAKRNQKAAEPNPSEDPKLPKEAFAAA